MTYTEKIGYIHSYLNGELNAEEKHSFLIWVDADVENKILFNQISQIWESAVPPAEIKFNADKAFKKHLARLQDESNTKVIPIKGKDQTGIFHLSWLRVAAAIFVVLIAFTLVFNNFNETKIEALTSRMVAMEDGSKVWLQEGSTLKIIKISSSKRQVELEGKAYFDVAPDKNAPFLIHADGLEVKVLGTRFTVDSRKTSVNVRDGRVAVNAGKEEVILTADESVVLNGKTLSPVGHIPFNASDLWFNEELRFDNAPFDRVIKDLSVNFGVNIQIPEKNDWSGCTFTSGALKNNSLDEIFVMLKLTYELEYTKTSASDYQIKRVKCK